MSRITPIAVVCAALTGLGTARAWERASVDFASIQSRARDLAGKPYAPPDGGKLPDWMKNLTYDQYRDIRFNPDQALWNTDKSAFRAQFFHPGYLFKEPVTINEITPTHEQRVRSSDAQFNYGPLIKERGEFPTDSGFAGFKLYASLYNSTPIDELIVLQGASYWRALGKNQRYGISARGLAIDTGVEGAPEEFPIFREFWLEKPEEGQKTVSFFALLDSPSYTGAYSFKVEPGDDTVVSVNAVLFARKAVKRLGIAPMSSMYWFGENSRRRFDDFRPEVHDSDGLAVRMGNGERIWRPLCNDTGRLEFSFFSMEKCDGFGLVQRDRRFAAYEDGEAAYDLRPSLWVEPTSDWGPGSVMLMEIPTGNELADNAVAMWVPERTPQPGDRMEFNYRQHWTMAPDPSQAAGRVVATRTGVHEWQPNQRTVIVEFAGGRLGDPEAADPQAVVEVLGAAKDKVKVQGVAVQRMGNDHWRLAFQLTPATEGVKLPDVGPVELRAFLKKGDDYLTETWSYRLIP